MMGHHGDWAWGGSILLTLAMVVFWALLTAAIVFAARYLISLPGGGSPPAGGPSRAESLLAERYARGEIGDDEYQHKLTLLHQHR
jgi:putative membrane protein